MKASEAIRKALGRRDAAAAGKIVDALRFNHGWTYAKISDLVRRSGGDPQEWESLLEEADSARG